MTVNIYLASGSRAPRRLKRSNCYILEVDTGKGVATATGFKDMDDTMHGASVRTLQAAAARLNKPVDLKVYTDDNYVAGMIRELESLRSTDFTKSDGEPAAYSEEWRSIARNIITADASTERHSYSDWMYRELEARRIERKEET